MNKIINIYIILLGMFFMVSCNDFIDQKPALNVPEADIYSDPARIESTVRGLYARMKNTGTTSFLGGKGYIAIDAKGDDVVNVSSNNVELLDVYKMVVNNAYADNINFWSNAYQTINRVNTFLVDVEVAKDLLGTDTYNQYRSEAMFVRAVCYYYLNNMYSRPYVLNQNAKSVPLRLKKENSIENNKLAASTVSEIYTQILADLSDENISYLPQTKNDYTTVTRATKGAAYMLKMRVYMSMNNWADAIKAGESVTGYELSADITSLFKSPFYTKESIFSLPMADNNRPNTQQSLAEFYNGTNNILLIDKTAGIFSKTNYNLADDARIRSFWDKSNDRLKKFTDAQNKLDWVPIFRYAETLLGLSESYANLGGTANETKAKELLKQVRSRSISSQLDSLDITSLTGDALKTAISNERRLEFIGEGLRGIDIIRKGETYKKGSGNNYIEVAPASLYYIWPIPYTETQINTEL